MKHIKLFFLLLLPLFSLSQNIDYARFVIDTLASPYLCGRYYVYDSDIKAAKFVASQLKQDYLKPFGKSYFQYFTIDTVNTFPVSPLVEINGKKLTPGKDFILKGYSGSDSGEYKVKILKIKDFTNPKRLLKLKKKNNRNLYFFIPEEISQDKELGKLTEAIVYSNLFNAQGYIIEKQKLTFIPSRTQKNFSVIEISDTVAEKPKKIFVNIKAEEKHNYRTQNVLAYLKGETDTFLVLTAHYDHIGCLGKDAVFTGAHDNASGVAMVLDLAKELSNRKCLPHYSIAFVFFSGEELGLLGSQYFAAHPLIPLNKVKLLINFDLLGSGDEGIMIFNGKDNPALIKKLEKINRKYSLVEKIVVRANRPNSDHYPFTQKGVNAIYVLTLGKYKEYHNIYDTRENIPLSDYKDVAKLMLLLINDLNNSPKILKTKK